MAVDCIPHASGHLYPHIHHTVQHHLYPKPLTHVIVKAAPKPRLVRHHVRLLECRPGAVVAPLADLDNDNVAAIYMLPYGRAPAAGDQAVTGDAVATTGAPDATPAEASGLDLPSGGLSDIGSMGGALGGSNGLTIGSGGGGAGSGDSSGGSGGSGGGGGGSGGGGSTRAGGPTTTGGRGAPGPVVVIPPITRVGDLPSGGGNNGGGGVSGVPEPSTWTLLSIGFGTLGAMLRKSRRQPANG